jgi:hypothetical protein
MNSEEWDLADVELLNLELLNSLKLTRLDLYRSHEYCLRRVASRCYYILHPRAGSASALCAMLTILFSRPTTLRK